MTICVFHDGMMLADTLVRDTGENGERVHKAISFSKIRPVPHECPVFNNGKDEPIKPDFMMMAGSVNTLRLAEIDILNVLSPFGLTEFVPGEYSIDGGRCLDDSDKSNECAIFFRCGKKGFLLDIESGKLTITDLRNRAAIGSGREIFGALADALYGDDDTDINAPFDALRLLLLSKVEDSIGGNISILMPGDDRFSTQPVRLSEESKARLYNAYRKRLYGAIGKPVPAFEKVEPVEVAKKTKKQTKKKPAKEN